MTTTNWPERDFVRTDFLGNVLVTAAVDGVVGWATVHDLDFKEWGGNLLWAFMEIGETDKNECLPVSLDDIEQGIQDIISGEVQIPDSDRRIIAEASAKSRSGDIDAALADCIVQVALYGEIVLRWEELHGTA